MDAIVVYFQSTSNFPSWTSRVRSRLPLFNLKPYSCFTYPVVRLDTLQVLLDQRDSRDLMRSNRLLDLRDGGLLNVKRRRDRHQADEEQNGYRNHLRVRIQFC